MGDTAVGYATSSGLPFEQEAAQLGGVPPAGHKVGDTMLQMAWKGLKMVGKGIAKATKYMFEKPQKPRKLKVGLRSASSSLRSEKDGLLEQFSNHNLKRSSTKEARPRLRNRQQTNANIPLGKFVDGGR